MIYNDKFVPHQIYSLPSNDFEKIHLPISPHGRLYVKFDPLHPSNDKDTLVWTDRERLNTFYTTNALPQEKTLSKYKITKFSCLGTKILRKFGQDCILYYYYAFRNSQVKIKILDIDFPYINPNDILVIAAHLKERQTSQFSTRAYNSALNYLKDFVAEFGRSNIDFSHLFKT